MPSQRLVRGKLGAPQSAGSFWPSPDLVFGFSKLHQLSCDWTELGCETWPLSENAFVLRVLTSRVCFGQFWVVGWGWGGDSGNR